MYSVAVVHTIEISWLAVTNELITFAHSIPNKLKSIVCLLLSSWYLYTHACAEKKKNDNIRSPRFRFAIKRNLFIVFFRSFYCQFIILIFIECLLFDEIGTCDVQWKRYRNFTCTISDFSGFCSRFAHASLTNLTKCSRFSTVRQKGEQRNLIAFEYFLFSRSSGGDELMIEKLFRVSFANGLELFIALE